MPKTTVQVTESTLDTPDGDTREIIQYRTTIPKQMAEFFDLKQGDEIEWSAGSASNKLELTIHKQ